MVCSAFYNLIPVVIPSIYLYYYLRLLPARPVQWAPPARGHGALHAEPARSLAAAAGAAGGDRLHLGPHPALSGEEDPQADDAVREEHHQRAGHVPQSADCQRH